MRDPIVGHPRAHHEVVYRPASAVDRTPQKADREHGAEDRPDERSAGPESVALSTHNPETHHLLADRSTAGRPAEREIRDQEHPPDPAEAQDAWVGPSERSGSNDERDRAEPEIEEQYGDEGRREIDGRGKERERPVRPDLPEPLGRPERDASERVLGRARVDPRRGGRSPRSRWSARSTRWDTKRSARMPLDADAITRFGCHRLGRVPDDLREVERVDHAFGDRDEIEAIDDPLDVDAGARPSRCRARRRWRRGPPSRPLRRDRHARSVRTSPTTGDRSGRPVRGPGRRDRADRSRASTRSGTSASANSLGGPLALESFIPPGLRSCWIAELPPDAGPRGRPAGSSPRVSGRIARSMPAAIRIARPRSSRMRCSERRRRPSRRCRSPADPRKPLDRPRPRRRSHRRGEVGSPIAGRSHERCPPPRAQRGRRRRADPPSRMPRDRSAATSAVVRAIHVRRAGTEIDHDDRDLAPVMSSSPSRRLSAAAGARFPAGVHLSQRTMIASPGSACAVSPWMIRTSRAITSDRPDGERHRWM